MQTERQIIMHGVNKAFLIKLGQIKDKKMQLCNNTYQNPWESRARLPSVNNNM